jgi:4-amino-4-deoxy-L-arabinose transferase-like glycosyltransferase
MSAKYFSRTSIPGWMLLLFAVTTVTWFAGLEFRGLFAPDEGRYASIAREMLASGDWITPRLNGLKYFEKPPLQYWATAAAFALFGADEWTARLWPAVTGFLGIALTAFAGSRLAPASPWLAAAMIAAGCWGYFLGAQYVTLDMGLTFFLTAATFCFMLSRREGLTRAEERKWMISAWAAAGFAVLSKGVVGVVLPSLALFVYVVIEGDWRLLRRLHWGPGLCVFAAIVLPWFVMVQLRNPEFFHFFFIHEHFERYLLPDHHRPGPWWYFVPVLAVGLLPWTPSVPAAFALAWKGPADSRFNFDRFLVLWVCVTVLFFSASHSKLPGYVLPALPAILLVFARKFPDLSRRMRGAPAVGCMAIGTGVTLLSMLLPTLAVRLSWVEFDPDYSAWLLAAGLVLLVAGGAAVVLLRREASGPSLAVLGLGSLIAVQLALSGTHLLDERYSSERTIESLTDRGLRFPREIPFYSVKIFDQSVTFYLGRPVTLVGLQDELAPGIAAEPEKYIASMDDFVGRWQRDAQAFAIMRPATYENLRRAGLPARVLVADPARIVIARR